ncbi:unnamed protein product [Trichobilharzia regenti]|nr:unnamed protein product [Trichobilharzia regenti]
MFSFNVFCLQYYSIAPCFIVVLVILLADYLNIAREVKQLFHEFNIHCTTIQPEFEEDTEGSPSDYLTCVLDCGPNKNCQSDTCCPASNVSASQPMPLNALSASQNSVVVGGGGGPVLNNASKYEQNNSSSDREVRLTLSN